jgi:hypothetical protein
MNRSNVRKWYRMFNEGRTNVHDEERSGRLSPITEVLKKQEPPYSPDLAPSDLHLFTHVKKFLGRTRMGSDEELKKISQAYRNSSHDTTSA